MNFDATPLDINEILSVKKKYVIPRNQREFSWERLQLDEFWNDIVRNIKTDRNEPEFNEYFIGTIVLSNSDGNTLEIVDGQQRISVITILLSLISRNLRKLKYASLAEDIFKTYIVTVSDQLNRNAISENGESLIAKVSRDNEYFKKLFQDRNAHDVKDCSDEDRRIRYAGTFFQRKLQKKALCRTMMKNDEDNYTAENHAYCLRCLYKMITGKLKVVRILVGASDDAYDIFEVLNARGMNLSSIDLIKNKIFQTCTTTYPVDKAKEKWNFIFRTLNEIDGNHSMVDYIRCWWLSQFGYIGEEQLYRSFKREIVNDENPSSLKPSDFLDKLYEDISIYSKIISPDLNDWKQMDQRSIYESLYAINMFNVSIPRPFLMALFKKRIEKPRILVQAKLIEILQFLESFHLSFNAICRLRPSGIDAKYSVFACKLNQIQTKKELHTFIEEVKEFFNRKKPAKSVFIDNIKKNLVYTNKKTQNKKLIQYLFEKIENHFNKTKEYKFNMVSIEHIAAQSSKINEKIIGSLGNLLPLDIFINEECGDRKVSEKIEYYKKSKLKIVFNFVQKFENDLSKDIWGENEIEKRTQSIASLIYSIL